jgi:hypothetical protein
MSPRALRILAITLAVIELLLAPLALFFAAMSVMMFDAPGSEHNDMLWVAFWSSWAWPITLLIGSVFEIMAAIRYTRRRMLIGLILPAIPVAVLILAFSAL